MAKKVKVKKGWKVDRKPRVEIVGPYRRSYPQISSHNQKGTLRYFVEPYERMPRRTKAQIRLLGTRKNPKAKK